MAKSPLDVLSEQNRMKKARRRGGPIALLEELNRERKQRRQRDLLLDQFRQPLRPKKGTLIIGVKCTDGVVIGSDTKVARGSEIEYTNKVFDLDLGGPVVLAAEGLTGIRDDFFLMMDIEISRRRGVDTLYEVKFITEDIIANLTERYAERLREAQPIGLLMGGLERVTSGPSTLYYIHAAGYGELVSFMCTGHGGTYAYSLAKFLFDPNLEPDILVEEAARRVAFVIAWVANDVDSDVGGTPQVRILRNDNTKAEDLPADIIKAQEQAAKDKKSRLAELFGFE